MGWWPWLGWGGVGDQRAQDHTGRWYCITYITSNTCVVSITCSVCTLVLFVLLVLFVFLVLPGLLVLLVLLKEQWWITPGGGD